MKNTKTLKWLLILACLLAAMFTFTLAAHSEIVDSGTCGAEGDGSNLTWTLDDKGTLTVSGTGEMSARAFFNRKDVKKVVIKNGATNIGDYAFLGCEGLTSVTIPDSVTSIGNEAFFRCTAIKELTVGKLIEQTTIQSMTIPRENLRTVVITGGVTNIGDYAFEGCTSLASVTIPDSVTSIGDYAFQYCESLTSVMIPDSVTSIGDYAFDDCERLKSVTIPDSVTSFGNEVFSWCTAIETLTVGKSIEQVSVSGMGIPTVDLRTVIITDGVTRIGDRAFDRCESLTSVTIPDSVTSIGDEAFASCKSLAGVKIPDGVTSIGNRTFSGCTGLTSVTIGNSVTSIGDSAFNGCESLTSVTIPDSVTNIGEYAFFYCTELKSVTIPDSVTSIGDYAFYGCTAIEKLTVGKPIGQVTVREMTIPTENLRTVVITDGVTNIGDYAFKGCTNLASVTIPSSVTSIGWQLGETVLKKNRKTLSYPAMTENAAVTSAATSFAYTNGFCDFYFSHVTSSDPVTLAEGGGNVYALCGLYTETVTLLPQNSQKAAATFSCKGFACGAGVIGDDGRLYLLWAKDASDALFDSAPDTCNVRVIQYELSGKQVASCDFPLKKTYSGWPYDGGNASLTYHEGTLLALWNTKWVGQYSSDGLHHQGLEEAIVRTKDMKCTSLTVNAGSHSFGVAAVKSRRGFICVQNNDASYPARSMSFREYDISKDNNCTTVAFSSPGQYGTNDHKLDGNATYISYIGAAQSCTTFATCCYGTEVYTSEVFKTSKLYPTATYDVFVRILDESLGASNAGDCAGKDRKDAATGETADKNVIRVTDFKGKYYAKNVKIVTLPCGAYCMLWNQYVKEKYDDPGCLHYVILDERGNLLKKDTAVKGALMSDYNVPPVVKGNRLIWAVGENGRVTWVTLDLKLNDFAGIMGDVDGNGKIEAADARLALRASVGLEPDIAAGSGAYLAADADGDGKVTSGDARLILRASVGLEDPKTFGKKA